MSGSYLGFRGPIPREPPWMNCIIIFKEVIELCLEEYKGRIKDLPQFVGLQQIEVSG
jgi:hypothetical protein